jgi:ribonuclease HII
MQLGVDEAGKGPVLGSMFAAAVRADPAVLPDGVDDSKRLPPARRERLAEAIREQAAAVSVVEVTVERIDDPATNMTDLTVEAHAEAVAGAAGENATGYLDAADTNAVRFERRVGTRVDGVELRAEHGADERYVVVSAASIVAKVERDAHVATLAEEYGDVGSGYPGDQTTRDFLRGFVHEHGRLPDCARESWQTSRDVLGELDQSSLSEFD